MKKSTHFFLSLVFLFTIFLVGCDPNVSTVANATTSLKLLDLSSGGSGKYGMTTISYWWDAHIEKIILCYHKHEDAQTTGEPTNCERYAVPRPLESSDKLLAFNQGAGQKTQSVWLKRKTNKMVICLNDHPFWETDPISSCDNFPKPPDIKDNATLASINSGNYIKAQSFWTSPDGITVCNHKKDGGWFDNSSFGAIESCAKMAIPSLLPAGLKNPMLVAVTSDGSRPWETFWQDDNGVVVRCRHDQNGGIGEDKTLGVANFCGYWKVPV